MVDVSLTAFCFPQNEPDAILAGEIVDYPMNKMIEAFQKFNRRHLIHNSATGHTRACTAIFPHASDLGCNRRDIEHGGARRDGLLCGLPAR